MSAARPMLGELLVERGVITLDELRAALAEQQRTGELLGAILIRSKGHLTCIRAK